ncbi:Cof-type HAD-IIB family hydrolase [Gracilibacillus caseinilyticus]|uniref:Cof-type HAD-IIB family hydrolase n=1 Tax=Gracilibacillus caseinilyticus TaxID=2932256 RepID=A0ABY4ETW1_9BACI|nr:HAD family hydrolase [Gracilibacillus caseinilyticus]UOQ47069.1 Cof-type HAD-IIB family hydrolase [Gracilibacillus caseinilyticus]
MNNFKALFLDIDGTILKQDHSIEASTKKAVKQAQTNGIEVFLATGRPLHEIDEIADTLQIDSLIGYNGAYAIYNGNTMVNEPLDGAMIDHYLEVAKQQQHEMILYTKGLNLLTNRTKEYVKEFINYFHLKDCQLYEQHFRDDILGITVMNVKPHEPVLYDLANENIYFSQVNVKGLEHNYDVIRENVNKGFAIQHTLKQLAIEPSQAIAFGDGMNDKQMLQAVEYSFAMGNANPELFAYAKYKTTSVEDSGIYNGLATLGIV